VTCMVNANIHCCFWKFHFIYLALDILQIHKLWKHMLHVIKVTIWPCFNWYSGFRLSGSLTNLLHMVNFPHRTVDLTPFSYGVHVCHYAVFHSTLYEQPDIHIAFVQGMLYHLIYSLTSGSYWFQTQIGPLYNSC
jgi:hypothetical protein